MEQDELKRLKRNELLEIIVRQKKRIEELEEQINKLEHADDQTLHLSFSEICSWSDTLRKLADLFEYGKKARSPIGPAPQNNVSAKAAETVPVHEEFDWKTTNKTAERTAADASFIEPEKIQWPSNR